MVHQVSQNDSLERRAQHQLARLSKKLYRMSAHYDQEPMLYLAEARCFAWLCGQPWAQRRYWPEQVDLVHTFLRATKLLDHNPSHTVNAVVRQTLLNFCLSECWFYRLATWPRHQLAQVIKVHGWETWLAATAQKKGVILTQSHTFGATLVWTWLAATGVQEFTSIDASHKIAKTLGVTATPENRPFLYARQLYAAKASLAAGGVVRILPDAFSEETGLSFPFYQRVRSFRTGFAELALLTNAPVVPVSNALDLQGRLTITFHPPLDLGDGSQRRAERIEQLVKQYVAFLHNVWAYAPSSIRPGHMQSFLEHSTPLSQKVIRQKSD